MSIEAITPRVGLSASFFEIALPGVSDSVRNGSVDRNIAIATAREFVHSRFRECQCALLFGSAKDGRTKALSDLDVLIVLPFVGNIEKRCEIYSGFPMEYYLCDLRSLTMQFRPDAQRGGRVLLEGVLTGLLIEGSAEIARTLVALAENAERGQRPPTDAAMVPSRAMVTSMMLELAANSASGEQFAIACQLCHILTTAFVQKETGFRNSAKWTEREFRRISPELAEELECSLRESFGTGSQLRFLACCENLLNRLGGPIWDGYRGIVRAPL